MVSAFFANEFAPGEPTKVAVRSKIREHLKEIRACYMDQVAKTPDLKGKIVINWSIDETGKVTQIAVDDAKTDLKDPAVQSCLTDKIKSWTFQPAAKGKVEAVTY